MEPKTFQDFIEAGGSTSFISDAIKAHVSSVECHIARSADNYDRQRNETINEYVQTIFSITGSPLKDYTAANNKIASNFFNRLNTQRCMYSLGNGITFAEDENGKIKESLGKDFDQKIQDAGYYALIHGVSFVFWNLDRIHVFPLTEFVPLLDEYDGTLKAGIRFWRLSKNKPLTAVLYEMDGYTKFQSDEDDALHVIEEKRAYKQTIATIPADGTSEVIGEENYSALPIVPVYGSRKKQSTLVGMREAIDSYDLIRSGFANDLTDCSQIYWIVANAGGMDDEDLARLRDRLKLTHMIPVDSDDGGSVTPYTQEIPYQARKQYLDDIRAGIYEDFGGLDVHTVAAGATNDHIDAAYQPLDENADDYERQITEAIKQILSLNGIEAEPVYKRNRISNQKEQVEIVTMEAQWLDQKTILAKLPNISPDEAQEILDNIDAEDQGRFVSTSIEEQTDESMTREEEI